MAVDMNVILDAWDKLKQRDDARTSEVSQKYKLVDLEDEGDEAKRKLNIISDEPLKRLVATRDFGDVKAGDYGGCIGEDVYLDPSDKSWIHPRSVVLGKSIVERNSVVSHGSTIEDSRLSGAKVQGSHIQSSDVKDSVILESNQNAIIQDSHIEDRSQVGPDAKIRHSLITGGSIVSDANIHHSQIDHSTVFNGSDVRNSTIEDSKVWDDSTVDHSVVVGSFLRSQSHVSGGARVEDRMLRNETVRGKTVDLSGDDLLDLDQDGMDL